jgi:hypothetical protein
VLVELGHVVTRSLEHTSQLQPVGVGLLSSHDGHVLDVGWETHGHSTSLLLSVEASEVETHGDDQNELDTPTSDVDVETGVIEWSLFSQIYLGAYDITDGKSSEHHGGGDNSLGGTGSVQVAPRDEQGLDARKEEGGVVAAHEPAGAGSGDLSKTDGTTDGEENDDSDNGPSHLDFVGDVDTEKQTDDTDGTGGHLHEDSGEGVCISAQDRPLQENDIPKPKPFVIRPPKAPIPPDGHAAQNHMAHQP